MDIKYNLFNCLIKSPANKEIDIESEIMNYKMNNPGKVPLIVFDFKASTLLVRSSNPTIRLWEVLCAGRAMECTKRAKTLFERFKNLGVQLAFFLDGPVKRGKLQTWIKRRNNDYKTQENKVFSEIRKNQEPIRKVGDLVQSYYDNFLEVAKDYGEIFTSFENECDIDLAFYASQKNAMAIFADDMDFLFMPGNWNVWSVKCFSFKNFKTNQFNRNELRNLFHLNENQMPIFAVLAGKHYDTMEMMKNNTLFKGFLSESKYDLLADYVRRNFSGIPLSDDDFHKLCGLVYDNGSCSSSLDDIKTCVQNTLDFYNCKKINSLETIPTWLQQHIKETNSIMIFTFLNLYPITINQTLIDLSISNVHPFAELVIPLIQRQMGIVLYDDKQENQNKEIEIYFKPNSEEPFQKQSFPAIYPSSEKNIKIPKIQDILEKISNEERVDILSWIITSEFGEMNFEFISNLKNSNFLIPSITLYYLVKEQHFTEQEADIVLLTIYQAEINSNCRTKIIQRPRQLVERAFWIAFTYTQVMYYFRNTLTVCGLYDWIGSDCFDGFLFHNLYSCKETLNFNPIQRYKLYNESNQ